MIKISSLISCSLDKIIKNGSWLWCRWRYFKVNEQNYSTTEPAPQVWSSRSQKFTKQESFAHTKFAKKRHQKNIRTEKIFNNPIKRNFFSVLFFFVCGSVAATFLYVLQKGFCVKKFKFLNKNFFSFIFFSNIQKIFFLKISEEKFCEISQHFPSKVNSNLFFYYFNFSSPLRQRKLGRMLTFFIMKRVSFVYEIRVNVLLRQLCVLISSRLDMIFTSHYSRSFRHEWKVPFFVSNCLSKGHSRYRESALKKNN